jgi:lipoyl(octanoyl) transferase
MRQPATVLSVERLGYEEAWVLQHRLVEQRLNDERPDTLVLLEHEPVYTIGRSGRVEHWRGEHHDSESSIHGSGIPVHHVERGGSVTYHGPGQVVGYPILRLSTYCPGPKSYMRMLEDVLIRTLTDWNIPSTRTDGLTGVWVLDDRPAKIGALGVRIARGITMHGFALNVAVDLTPFTRIVPCGLAGCHVTSMERVLGTAPNLSAVRQRIAIHFSSVFGIEWRDHPTAVGLEAGLAITAPAVE